ncbi:MAG: 50S ribosomal protein L22 [Candidatus Micrarchaeota archaeon]
MANYAYQPAKNERVARARVEGVNASYKDLCNVCSNVRGRRADKALQFLTEAADGERPVRYFNYNKRRGHLRELGGKKGGWPVKSCKIVRDLLANAMANAVAKNMGDCKISHIQANKQDIFGRMSPKGRRIRQDLETAFVEIVLEELKAPPAPKAGAKKDAKTPEAKKGETKKTAETTLEAKKAEAKPVEAKKAEEKKEPKPIEAPKSEAKPAEAKKAEEKKVPAPATAAPVRN